MDYYHQDFGDLFLSAPPHDYLHSPSRFGLSSCFQEDTGDAPLQFSRPSRKKRSIAHRHKKPRNESKSSFSSIMPAAALQSYRRADLVEGHKQRLTTTCPHSIKSVRSTKISSTVSTSNAIEETALKNKRLVLLLEKTLTRSDVGPLGRIILPKLDAESNLPSLKNGEHMWLQLKDITGVYTWQFNYRCWRNIRNRMYVFHDTCEFVKYHDLVKGDKISVYEDLDIKQFVVGVELIGCRAYASANDIIPLTSISQLKNASKQDYNDTLECNDTNTMDNFLPINTLDMWENTSTNGFSERWLEDEKLLEILEADMNAIFNYSQIVMSDEESDMGIMNFLSQ